MRFSAVATVLTALVSGVTAIPQAEFNSLQWAAGVAWAYTQNNCNLPAINDRGGRRWEQRFSFAIKDQGGGDITVRIFRRPVSGGQSELYLFFPGTKDTTNWQTNTDATLVSYTFNGLCNACKIHRGFLNAWLNGRTAVVNNMKFVKNIFPNDKFFIVGGSLGGALASLAYGDLISNWSYGLIPDAGISFGQPRVGDGQWAAFMNQVTQGGSSTPKWTRVTHGYDSIVRAPPPQWGYMHFGAETWARDYVPNGNRPNAGSTNVCPLGGFGSEPTGCSLSPDGPGNPGDHLTYPGYNSEAASCTAP